MSYRVVLSDQKTMDVETGREVFERASVETEGEDESAVELDVVEDPPRTPEAVLDALGNAAGLIVDAGTPVTADVLERASGLRVVGRAGIGVDNVDVAAATANDVQVINVPDYAIEEVSTHALALLLGCVRKVAVYDRQVKNGVWNWEDGRPLYRLQGKTLGLVAFGSIARRFAEKVSGLGLDVIVYDRYVDQEVITDAGAEKVGFEELLDRSDLLSVHAPLTDETEGLLDRDAFERLGEKAIVVNTARGGVIDSDALAAALDNGSIAAAGLDVFDPEPPGDSPVIERENVLVTPHTAWYSEESRRDLSRSVATDVLRVLRGETPDSPVDPDAGWF